MQYAENFVDNGISGRHLTMLTCKDLEETLLVTNNLHRNIILIEISHLFENSSKNPKPVQWTMPLKGADEAQSPPCFRPLPRLLHRGSDVHPLNRQDIVPDYRGQDPRTQRSYSVPINIELNVRSSGYSVTSPAPHLNENSVVYCDRVCNDSGSISPIRRSLSMGHPRDTMSQTISRKPSVDACSTSSRYSRKESSSGSSKPDDDIWSSKSPIFPQSPPHFFEKTTSRSMHSDRSPEVGEGADQALLSPRELTGARSSYKINMQKGLRTSQVPESSTSRRVSTESIRRLSSTSRRDSYASQRSRGRSEHSTISIDISPKNKPTLKTSPGSNARFTIPSPPNIRALDIAFSEEKHEMFQTPPTSPLRENKINDLHLSPTDKRTPYNAEYLSLGVALLGERTSESRSSRSSSPVRLRGRSLPVTPVTLPENGSPSLENAFVMKKFISSPGQFIANKQPRPSLDTSRLIEIASGLDNSRNVLSNSTSIESDTGRSSSESTSVTSLRRKSSQTSFGPSVTPSPRSTNSASYSSFHGHRKSRPSIDHASTSEVSLSGSIFNSDTESRSEDLLEAGNFKILKRRKTHTRIEFPDGQKKWIETRSLARVETR